MLPRGRVRVKTALALTQNGVLDLDLKVVTVTGTVKVNGGAMPSDPSYPRGEIIFVDTVTRSETRFELPASGAATYQLKLFIGSYDTHFDGGSHQTVVPRGTRG